MRKKVLAKIMIIVLVFLFSLSEATFALASELVSDSEASVPAEQLLIPEGTVLNDVAAEATAPEDSLLDSLAGEESLSQPMASVLTTNPSRETITNKLRLEKDSNTGALSYNYPIVTPPGRNKMQPDLKLMYNNQINNQNNNLFGFGWSVNIPYIERIDREGKNNLYNVNNYFYSSLSGEINRVSTSSNEFGAKVENGDFLKYELINNEYWQVENKMGLTYIFGQTASARQDNPSDSSKIYKWQLEKVIDANGNYIKYEYYKDSGQIYPDKIKYTGFDTDPGLFEVEFGRESRSDVAVSYEPAFKVKTNYRINQILSKVNGVWAHKYQLAYTTGFNGSRSLLSSITESGQDEESNVISLPAESFTYQARQKGWAINSSYGLPSTFSTANSRIFDVNGDGLIDIVLDDNPDVVLINNGLGTGWGGNSNYTVPADIWSSYSRLGDVNGDGLMDFVFHSTSYNRTYINKGDGTGWQINSSWATPVDFGNTKTLLIDLNGDFLPDILYYNGTSASVYLNNGSSWTLATSWTVPIYGSNTAVFDYNNDNLPDIVYKNNWSEAVYLNTGSGWVQDTEFSFPFNLDTTFGYKFVDFTADGIEDLLFDYNTSNGFYVNNGRGFSSNDSAWATSSMYINQSHVVADINGNITPDVIKSTAVYTADSIVPDLLSQVSYSEGGTAQIEYKSSSLYKDIFNNNLNPNLPSNIMAVSKITTSDGLGNSVKKLYEYEGGYYYYNGVYDRKFAGFHKVKETDDETGYYKIDYYHQGNGTNSSLGEYSDHISKINKAYRTEFYNENNQLYQAEVNKWENVALDGARNFVKLTRKTQLDYDGNSDHKDKAQAFSYDDATGNLSRSTSYGEVSASSNGDFTDSGSDAYYEDIAYATSSSYLVGFPKIKTIKNLSDETQKETKYFYDNLDWGQIDLGNLSKQMDLKSGSDYINTKRYSYNSYGLVSSETDPRDKVTSYTYDQYNLYPATVANPLSQVVEYLYDYSSGQIKQLTDANDFIFSTSFDALDRKIEEKQPDLSAPSNQLVKTAYSYTNTFPRSLAQVDYLNSATSTEMISYFDGLGRKVQTRKKAEGDSNYSVNDFIYNTFGLLEKESLPYYSLGSSRTNPTTDASLYSNYYYDALNRLTRTVNTTGTIYNSYDNWQLAITDQNGKNKILYYDAFDNLLRVDEKNGAATYSTNYEYNYLGDLKKITDAAGNVRNFSYDKLSRLTQSEDLHNSSDTTFGVSSYSYDDASNISTKTNPNNQTVNFSYDDINRKLSEGYTGESGVELSWFYDSCQNGVGRLCVASSTAIIMEYYYNPLGLVETEEKTIDSQTYATSYTYNRQGNIDEITYPDNSQVLYVYNNFGSLEKIQQKEAGAGDYSDLVLNFDYNPMGQTTQEQFTNNVVSLYGYDKDKLYRLKSKQTIAPTLGLKMAFGDDLSLSPEELLLSQKAFKDSAGSILLNEAIELKAKANENSKTYLLGYDKDGNEIRRTTLYGAPTFYKEKESGEYKTIEAKLEDSKNGLVLKQAPYSARAEKDASGQIVVYETDKINLIWSLETSSNASAKKKLSRSVDKQAVYQNALGKDLDLSLTFADYYLAKEAVINNQSALDNLSRAGDYYELSFRLRSPQSFDLKIDGELLSQQGEIISSSQAEIINHLGEAASYILPPLISDGAKTESIEIKYVHLNDNEILITKLLPAEYFSEASYPVRTDATISPYAVAASNGYVYKTATTWSTARSAATGTGNSTYSLATPEIQVTYQSYNIKDWTISRSYFAFDTSTIEDWADVQSAKLSVYFVKINNALIDGRTYYAITESTQNSPTQLVNGDYSRAGFVNGTRNDSKLYCTKTECNMNARHGFYLNQTGLNWINKQGYTKLAMLDGHDLENDNSGFLALPPKSSGGYNNYPSFRVTNYPGLDYDPYLEVTYILPAGINTPTNLKVNGLSSPAALSTSTPIFTAQYNNSDQSKSAYYYQIQISENSADWTTPLWDSTKTALGTPVPSGSSSGNISYSGSALASNMIYYWRIRFYDQSNNASDWSSGSDHFYIIGAYVDLQDLSYTYDNVGNITQIADSSDTNTAKTSNFAYDDLYRLTGATTTSAVYGGNYSQNYAYNLLGNIVTKSDVGSYSYNGHQGTSYANPHAATTINSLAQEYDNNGNLISDSIWDYSWDYNNHLIEATNSTTTLTYAYDHEGNRIKTDDGTNITYYPNKYYNITGATSTKQIYANNQLIATIESNGTSTAIYYVHNDHLGGSSVITDESGQLAELIDYYPFGQIRFDQKNGSFNEPKKYTGYQYDPETDLNYAGARYQSGRIGRFMGQDPVFQEASFDFGDPQSMNSYSYARNNPLKFNDSDGKWFRDVVSGRQSFSGFTMELGDAGNALHSQSAVGRAVMDHPVATGVVAGLGSGAAVAFAPTVVRQGAIGLVGGIMGQGLSDAVGNMVGARNGASSLGDYIGSGAKGLTIGVVAEGGALVAGGVSSLLSAASSYENSGKVSVGNAIFEGAVTAGTMGLTGMSSKVVGRQPNVGSLNYYLGAHARQSYLKSVTETIAATVAGVIKTETQLIKSQKK